MNFIESLFINLGLSIIRSVVKNPAHAAALQGHLLGLADQIYTAYGIAPPDHGIKTITEK